MSHGPPVPGALPSGDRVVVCAERAPSGKQGMQADGRAEGARASTPSAAVGPGVSTTAAQQRRACHAHQRNLRWGLKEGN